MINELYQLSKAMEQAEIKAQSWHRKYKPIPNIRPNAPCICISLHEGKVTDIFEIEPETGVGLRKFGSNQGSYPGMNLAPLYRVTDEEVKKKISELHPEDMDALGIEMLRSWCTENNWGRKFQKKYRISMESTPQELKSLLSTVEYEPLSILMKETESFIEPELLHRELERIVFYMLSRKEKVTLALKLLFHMGNPQKNAENDSGTLSVILDSEKLARMGIQAASVTFTKGLNDALQEAESIENDSEDTSETDAFGVRFSPLEEPMPEVKLAGGFDVKLRTMFKEQRCQNRYGRIENASYPISPLMRKKLQTALNWLGSEAQKDNTWINIDKDEILFAYPYQLPSTSVSYTQMFKRQKKKEILFKGQAKQFISELELSHQPDEDSHARNIEIFVLRKIDKARAKVVYSYLTDPYELESAAEKWIMGCEDNLPRFSFGQPKALFPVEASDAFNCIWRRDGTLVTAKFQPYPRYYGVKLLLERELQIQRDLHVLVQNATALGVYLCKLSREDLKNPIWWKAKDLLALLGLLLYRENIRKEQYMEEYPYLYGQLLKVSDELHELYCKAERKGDFPTQLVGGSLFQSALDAPVRTLVLLGQRMNVYIMWAKCYCAKEAVKGNVEIRYVRWRLSLYEKLAYKLQTVWKSDVRFTDAEKAQLFIGYLAAFRQKEQIKNDAIKEEEEENIDE